MRLLKRLTVCLMLLALCAACVEDDPQRLFCDDEGRPMLDWDGWRLETVQPFEGGLAAEFSQDGTRLNIFLQPRDDRSARFGNSAYYNVHYRCLSVCENETAFAALLERVLENIRRREREGGAPGSAGLARKSAETPSAQALFDIRKAYRERAPRHFDFLKIFYFAVIAALMAAAAAGAAAAWNNLKGLKAYELRLIAAFSLAGLLLRVSAPARLVQLYSGYALVNDAAAFDYLPAYGGGWYAMFHLLFELLPVGHASVIQVNLLLSALLPPLVAAFCAVFIKRDGVAAAAAFLTAFLPLAVKDANSESMLVSAACWIFLALPLWLKYLEEGRLRQAAALLALLLMAALSRPLMILLPLPFLILGLAHENGKARIRKLMPQIAIAVLLFVLLLLPNHILIAQGVAHSGFPYAARLGAALFGGIGAYLGGANLFFSAAYVPLFLPLLAAVGIFTLWKSAQLAKVAALLLVNYLFFAVYTIDQPPPSMPRLQMIPLYFIVPLCACGLVAVAEMLRRISGFSRPAVAAALLLLYFSSALYTLPALWKLDNSAEEERLIAALPDKLPSGGYVLLRRGLSDAPRDFIDVAFPDYLFQRRCANCAVSDISEYFKLRKNGVEMPRLPLYFYVGTRCYAQQQHDESLYGTWKMHPVCASVFENFKTEAVFVEDVVNHPENYHRYPPDDFLKMGLYRISDEAQ